MVMTWLGSLYFSRSTQRTSYSTQDLLCGAISSSQCFFWHRLPQYHALPHRHRLHAAYVPHAKHMRVLRASFFRAHDLLWDGFPSYQCFLWHSLPQYHASAHGHFVVADASPQTQQTRGIISNHNRNKQMFWAGRIATNEYGNVEYFVQSMRTCQHFFFCSYMFFWARFLQKLYWIFIQWGFAARFLQKFYWTLIHWGLAARFLQKLCGDWHMAVAASLGSGRQFPSKASLNLSPIRLVKTPSSNLTPAWAGSLSCSGLPATWTPPLYRWHPWKHTLGLRSQAAGKN